MFHINLNTKPKQVKRDQVRKNNGEEVIPITTHTFKRFQNIALHKSLNIDLYIDKQIVPNMGVGKF
jgi:hypothetical protein